MLDALQVEGERLNVRKVIIKQSNNCSNAANPGLLKSKATWHEWEPKIIHFSFTVIGVVCVPLSYVVHENKQLDHISSFVDSIEQTVAQVPLYGIN